MTSRPILFSAPMVRSLLAGTKTQTRRGIKPQPHADFDPITVNGPRWFDNSGKAKFEDDTIFKCPYGQPGDTLWCKETFMPMPHLNAQAFYRASDPLVGGKWKPSIFMPRDLSRITLEITAIRVERLHSISETDALAEGCSGDCPVGYIPAHQAGPCAYEYAQLWESINGPGSWAANPFVWVLSFKRLKP